MRKDDPPLPGLITRSGARRRGLTDRQISSRVERGAWRRVRHGVLAVPVPGRPMPDPADEQLVAAVSSTGRDVAVSLAHAARLWGLPRPLSGWGSPVLLAASGANRVRNDVAIRVAPSADGDLLLLERTLAVTSPRRTVVDCLRHLPAPDGLAIADAALRGGLVTPQDLVAGVAAAAGWPGIRRARRLASIADGRRETPLESWSALAFHVNSIPMPLWQVDVGDDDGFVGRVDAWWREGVVGEADGRAKYLLATAERGGADARTLAEVLHRERERERRLRRAGADVVRWGAAEVLGRRRAEQLAEGVRRSIAAGPGRTFTGRTALPPLLLAPSAGASRLRTAERYRLRP